MCSLIDSTCTIISFDLRRLFLHYVIFISGLSGLYRKHGSSRYAPMPSGTYAGNQPVGNYASSPAHLMATPPAPVPFSPNFGEVATLDVGGGSISNNAPPPTLPPQPSIGPMSGMGYVPNATGEFLCNNMFVVLKNAPLNHYFNISV